MVAAFPRSLSLSLSGLRPASPVHAKGNMQAEKSYHVRSSSLPCRSHPIISEVKDRIHALRAWQSKPESGSSSSLCIGLSLLDDLHTSLDALLRLPKFLDTLSRRFAWAERILDDFLRLVDAHGTFRTAVMALKQHQSAAQAAIRRCDEVTLASCIKSQRRLEKELVKVASTLREVSRPLQSTAVFMSDAGEDELAGILREVTLVTVSTSASVFLGFSVASSSATSAVVASSSSARSSWMVGPLKKLSSSLKKKSINVENEEAETVARRLNAQKGLERLEENIEVLEMRNERVLRSLVNARVTFLNALNPSL